jgi:hypothetical protein
MPIPRAPWEEDDEEDSTGAEPSPQDLDAAAQTGDVTQQKAIAMPQQGPGAPPTAQPPLPPPQYAAQQDLQDFTKKGPPQQPNPSIWRRLAAGALAGAAGFENVKAGRPGGPTRPIDTSAATAGILGKTGYDQKLKNWTLQESAKDKAAQLEEKQNNDLLTYQERKANIDSANAARQATIAAERDRTADRNYSQQSAYAGLPTWDSASQDVTYQPQPLEESQSGPQAKDLPPNADLSDNLNALPQRAGLPPGAPPSLPPFTVGNGQMKPGYSQMPPPPSMTSAQAAALGPRFAPTVATAEAEKAQAAANAKNADLPVMTPEYQSYLSDLGLAAPIEMGKPIPVPVQDQLFRSVDKAMTVKTTKPQMTSDDLMALRASGAHTGLPEWDAIPQTSAKAAMALKHPPSQINNQMPATPAFSAPPELIDGKDETYLKSLDPMEAAQVRQAANYDLPVTGNYFMSKGPGLKLAAEAQRYRPDFSPAKYDQVKATRQAYSPAAHTGQPGRNILSLNTLMQHSNELFSNLQALNNGDTTFANTINNWFQQQGGAGPITGAQLPRVAVATEIATALKGTGAPNEAEIKKWYDVLGTNASPAQQAQAKREIATVGADRLKEANYQYVQNAEAGPYKSILSPWAERFMRGAGLGDNDIQEIRTGRANFNPQASGAPAKAVSQANVDAWAAQNHVTPALASKHYTDAGYTITK